MGGDSLMTFHYWKDWEKLASCIPIAVITRPEFELASGFSLLAKKMQRHRFADNAASILPQQKAPAWVYVRAPLDPISSTALRTG